MFSRFLVRLLWITVHLSEKIKGILKQRHYSKVLIFLSLKLTQGSVRGGRAPWLSRMMLMVVLIISGFGVMAVNETPVCPLTSDVAPTLLLSPLVSLDLEHKRRTYTGETMEEKHTWALRRSRWKDTVNPSIACHALHMLKIIFKVFDQAPQTLGEGSPWACVAFRNKQKLDSPM